MEKIIIGQCIEGTRAQPFISDQAAYLSRYRSVVLTRRGIYQAGWTDTPIIVAGPSEPPLSRKLYRKLGDVFGVPGEFIGAIRKYKPQLLHAHHGMFALNFLRLRRWTHLPLIVSFYGFDASGFPNSSPINAVRLKFLFKEASLVISMSHDMRNDLLKWGCPPEKIVIHHTGVDLERFAYRPPLERRQQTVILCVCDYSPKKGIPELLAAFKLALNKYPDIRLRLVGSPITIAQEEYIRVKQIIRVEGLTKMVTMASRLDYFSIPSEYRQADLFILPSVTAPDGSKEGIPAVLMEAQSTGLPVISTFHAGIPEVVADGKSGYLVKQHDINALAATLCRLLDQRNQWEAMGKSGREYMEQHFDVRNQRQRLEQIYDSILESRPM